MRQIDKIKGKGFEKLYPSASPLAIDMLKKMMAFDPSKRITISQALEHPYLSSLHFEDDEPTTVPVSRFDFEFEKQLLTARELKDMVYEEILLYHFPEKVESYNDTKMEFEKSIMQVS